MVGPPAIGKACAKPSALPLPPTVPQWSFAEWRLGLLWEEEILFLDFFFPNPDNLTDKDLRRFFKETEE